MVLNLPQARGLILHSLRQFGPQELGTIAVQMHERLDVRATLVGLIREDLVAYSRSGFYSIVMDQPAPTEDV